jgi:hypothetical protein
VDFIKHSMYISIGVLLAVNALLWTPGCGPVDDEEETEPQTVDLPETPCKNDPAKCRYQE